MQGNHAAAAALALTLVYLPVRAGAVDLDERLDRALQRVLEGQAPRYDQPLLLADLTQRPVRRFTNFSGDLSGRYIGALSAAASRREIPESRLRALVRDALHHQLPNGSFGKSWSGLRVSDDVMATMWGNGRLLVGLLDFYEFAEDSAVLEAAARLGDHILSRLPVFHEPAVMARLTRGQRALGFICWTQNVEGLAKLSALSGESRYLGGAAEIAARISTAPGQHSHGLLSSLRGVLDMHRQDRAGGWLRSVEALWSEISDSRHLSPTGSVAEYLDPEPRRDEGCSIADWLLLSLDLWHLTGDTRYIESAERTWFNGFAANQFASGDFGHAFWDGLGYDFGGERAWWCCTLHGLRAIVSVSSAAFRIQGGALLYDLAVDAEAESAGLAVRADAVLLDHSSVTLSVISATEESRVIGVRRPRWARSVSLVRNGRQVDSRMEGGYALVEGVWNMGDELRVEFAMRTELLRHGSRAGYRAVKFGPWILAASEESDPAFFGEGRERNVAELNSLGKDPGDLASLTVRYAHAGYSEQPRVARLLPVAERGSRSGVGRWQIWLMSEDPPSPRRNPLSQLAKGGPWPRAGAVAIGALLAGALVLWRLKRRRKQAEDSFRKK